MKLSGEIDQSDLTIRIIDQAKPVDITKVRGRDLKDLRPGGLGTFIMGQVFDDVKYEPLEVGTCLRLRKKLP
jgi:serine/threonine-protein kinase RsbW